MIRLLRSYSTRSITQTMATRAKVSSGKASRKRKSANSADQASETKSPYFNTTSPVTPTSSGDTSSLPPKSLRSKIPSKHAKAQVTEANSSGNTSSLPQKGQESKMQSKSSRLGLSFYQKSCVELSKKLLGQTLVRNLDGQRVAGRIVETEAYLGADDSAANTYKGRRTKANGTMYMRAGHLYVYMTYGMYHCINVTSQDEGQAALIRALAPMEGTSAMSKLRAKASKNSNKEFKVKELCQGPAKLTMALAIDKTMDSTDLTTSDSVWIESGDLIVDEDIVCCPRIGIDSATKEWVEKPLRFYVRGEGCVSKRNKAVELESASSK